MKIERITLIVSLFLNLAQGLNEMAIQWFERINQLPVNYNNIRQWNPEGIRDTSNFQIATPPVNGHKNMASKK